MIKENLKIVEENIRKACERSGRKREEVTLIAVSKTKPVSDILQVIEEGIKDFGENKVQELADKYEAIQKPLNWHMIGHLQRNKVKYIVDKACLIHCKILLNGFRAYLFSQTQRIHRVDQTGIHRPGGSFSKASRHLCKGADDNCPVCGRPRGEPDLL